MLNYKTYNTNKEEWLVLVHGISGNISTWDNQVSDLKEKYNLLILDLPWHGKSEIKEKLTKEVLNEEIKTVLDSEGIKKAHFIGMSLGSLVVSQFAIKYPDYINRLIFAGSVIQVRMICKLIVAIAEPFRFVLPYKLIYNLAIAIIVPKSKSKMDGQFFRNGFILMGREKLIEWIEYLKVVLDGDNVMNTLKEMNKKIFFISGEYDKMFLKGASRSAELLGRKLSVMKNCTHVCNNDNVELFNRRIIHFLSCEKTPKQCTI